MRGVHDPQAHQQTVDKMDPLAATLTEIAAELRAVRLLIERRDA